MINKKILITGGLGYIGSKFLSIYKNQYKLKILDTNYFANNEPINSTHEVLIKDIRDLTLSDVKNVDYVLHLSELSNDPLGNINSNLTNEINVLGTKKLIDLCNESNVQNFIYMSSCSVYGKTKDKYVDEDSTTNPLTAYSSSKILNENYILENNHNFPITIFRNATVFGYSPNLRLDLVINDLTYSAYKYRKITLNSDGTPKRPFVHIQDLVALINYFFEKNLYFDNQIINIGNEILNFSIKEVAEVISAITGVKDITFGKSDRDQRSYLVKFDKFKNLIPEFNFEFDLKLGVKDLMENFKYYEEKISSRRINQIQNLLKQKKIDSNLRWN